MNLQYINFLTWFAIKMSPFDFLIFNTTSDKDHYGCQVYLSLSKGKQNADVNGKHNPYVPFYYIEVSVVSLRNVVSTV